MSSHTTSGPRMNVGYQMAYACAVRRMFPRSPFTFFGWWAESQGQLHNPRPYLLTDEQRLNKSTGE